MIAFNLFGFNVKKWGLDTKATDGTAFADANKPAMRRFRLAKVQHTSPNAGLRWD